MCGGERRGGGGGGGGGGGVIDDGWLEKSTICKSHTLAKITCSHLLLYLSLWLLVPGPSSQFFPLHPIHNLL